MQSRTNILTKFPMADWPQMDRFIAITHGDSHVLRNRPLFDWLFLRNENRHEANLLVAYEGDRLISLLGYIPTRFRWGDDVVDGVWMAHWMTLKEYRFGIGALLMKKMIEIFPIVAGQGASSMNQAIVTRLGFRFTERIPKVVYVFNPIRLKELFNYQPATKPTDEDLEDLPAETTVINEMTYNPVWQLYPSLRYGTLRDHHYLSHRYIKYPFFKYHVFVEGEASSPSVCVSRIIDTTVGMRVARVLEFFFPETDPGKQQGVLLARKCINFFRQCSCDYADFYCTARTHIDILKDVGFIDEAAGALPSLLDPVDLSRKYQNIEVFVSQELRKKYPCSETDFAVTRADGDQDRPNASFRILHKKKGGERNHDDE